MYANNQIKLSECKQSICVIETLSVLEFDNHKNHYIIYFIK